MYNKYVSIIVPTYNDWSRLRLCVDALIKQSYSNEMFEVIIVNNNPVDNIPDDFLLPPNYLIITEEKPGSYAARNAGISVAKGEIIGFTDSDCIPDKDWIKNALEFFENNRSYSRIAGYISVFPKLNKATTAEKYDKLYSFKQRAYVLNKGTCVTGNLFAYKFVFQEVGLFNDSKMSFGDLDWGIEANKKGFTIAYVPNVIINHPARDLSELIKKEKRLVGGREKAYKGKKRLTAYINFVKEARPVLGEYKSIRNKGMSLNHCETFSLFLLRIRLRYIRACEAMKIRLGKKPNRE